MDFDKEKIVTECIVSYIDVLGASNKIRNNAQESLVIVHDCYTKAIDNFNKLFDNNKIIPNLKIFSDNIVISIENTHGISSLLAILMMSAIVQIEFLKKGWLVRGGVSLGSYFIDEVMVWGAGLINSHDLEEHVAVYPRIVIDPALIEKFNLADSKNKSHCKEWIVQDIDGLYYIDSINDHLNNADILVFQLLNVVEKEVCKNLNNPKICQKWIWFNSYLMSKINNQ